MLSMAKLREEHNSDRGLIPLKKIFNEILRKKREKVRKKIHKQKPHTHTHKLAQHSWHQDPRKEKCYKAKKGDWTCDRNQCLAPKPPGPQCPGCQEFYGSVETHWFVQHASRRSFLKSFSSRKLKGKRKLGRNISQTQHHRRIADRLFPLPICHEMIVRFIKKTVTFSQEKDLWQRQRQCGPRGLAGLQPDPLAQPGFVAAEGLRRGSKWYSGCNSFSTTAGRVTLPSSSSASYSGDLQ